MKLGLDQHRRRSAAARWWRTVAALTLAAVYGCAPPAGEPPLSAAQRLDEVGQAWHQLETDTNPWLQVKYDVATRELPDLSLAAAERKSTAARALLERLAAVDADALDHAGWVTLETLRWDLAILAEEVEHYWLRFPITPYSFSWFGAHMLLRSTAVADEEDARRYLDLVRGYPAFVDALVTRLGGQKERGIVMPLPELDLVVPTWRAFPEAPETLFPHLAATDEDLPEGFRDELARLVENEVKPAWERLAVFLDGAYRDAAPEAVGVAQYPGGREYYDFMIRWSTTLATSPQEIHRLGMEHITATRERMDEIRDRLDFAGSRDELHRQLESDPRLFATTPAEVEERLLAHVAAIEPTLDAFFTRRPEAPFRLTRLSPELESSMTYGYYQEPTADDPRGTYYFNGSSLDERSLIGAASLIYHELAPGHHFQVALQSENPGIPEYRRDSWHDAFGEGWAEYASMLAEEMGMYRDPYDLYGRLADQSFFAARLVVDTGMNGSATDGLGWSRQRASEFLGANTLASPTEIATETLRYAADIPAQALAYGLGSLKIHQLREHARDALGERFDIRRFHAAVLEYGSMPLAVLEQHIDWFIAEELKR